MLYNHEISKELLYWKNSCGQFELLGDFPAFCLKRIFMAKPAKRLQYWQLYNWTYGKARRVKVCCWFIRSFWRPKHPQDVFLKIYLRQATLNGARKVAHSPNQLPFVRNCVSPKACNFHPRPQLFPSIPPTRTRMVLVDTYFLRTDIEWLTFKRLAPNRCFSSF